MNLPNLNTYKENLNNYDIIEMLCPSLVVSSDETYLDTFREVAQEMISNEENVSERYRKILANCWISEISKQDTKMSACVIIDDLLTLLKQHTSKDFWKAYIKMIERGKDGNI